MCEILVCVKNRGSNPGAPRQGDVICVQPDGWAWSPCELGQSVEGNPNGKHNFFRVVKLPNVTAAQASRMLAPQLDIDPQNHSPYLRFRAFYLDRTKIPSGALRTYWDDDARAQGFAVINHTAAQLNNIVSERDRVAF